MTKSLNTILSYASSFIIIVFLFGCDSPETYVYTGHQMPKSYVEEIKSLGLLEEGEKIKYFYSDAIADIKDGFYFVTDQKLVAYSEDWQEPKTIIPYNDIIALDVEYHESYYEDSYIMVETKDGLELDFPVSSEKKRDKDFFNYILEKSNLNKSDTSSNSSQ